MKYWMAAAAYDSTSICRTVSLIGRQGGRLRYLGVVQTVIAAPAACLLVGEKQVGGFDLSRRGVYRE